MRFICLLLIPAFLFACKSKNSKSKSAPVTFYIPEFNAPGPAAIIYKTKADYNKLVPVILSDDKLSIISYPHPTDIKSGETYQLPTLLNNGYLLDNRGINKNVAFLSMDYETYSGLKELPSLTELYNLIVDKDPLTELCNCGNKTALTDPIKQLNTLIDSSRLRNVCLPIK